MDIPTGQGGQRLHRAQSGPIGLMLVFALVIAGTTIIVALGAGIITDTQGQIHSEQNEKAMTQLDSQAALVALGDSEVQNVDLSGTDSNYVVDDSAGHINVSYENQTDGSTTTIISEDLGSIVYETNNDGTIAYQGGGVWRSDPSNGSLMVSPPEFHYRDETLTLPLITVGSSGTLDNDASISRMSTSQEFPNETLTNPLENARVRVNVTSEYYEAWGGYFETRTDGEVDYDHDNNRVTLTLVTPLQNTEINSATSSLSTSGAFEINGGTNTLCGDSIYTNSYNSSESGNYCDQASAGTTGTNGDVIYGGDIDISDGSGGNDIRGDVVAGDSVIVAPGSGKPGVYGNISYTTNCNPSPDDCEDQIEDPDGEVRQISGLDESTAINSIVVNQAEEVEDENNNSDTGNVSSNSLQFGNAGTSDTVELSNGSYYLSDITVSTDQTVLLDTTEGNITLVVEENIDLGTNANITVVGDNTANVYVLGQGGNTNQLYMGSSSEIRNDGDDSPQFRLFGRDNMTALIGSGSGGNLARFVGVIYAPPGISGSGSVTLDGGAIYGGLVTGTTSIDSGNGGSIHYDEALENRSVIDRSQSVIRVTYVHASVNEIQVDD